LFLYEGVARHAYAYDAVSIPMTELGACSFSVAFHNVYKFTGKELDSESGLDNFGARYNASTMGGMTPDSFYNDSHVGDPQSWNEYAYARNSPLTAVDSC